MKKYYSVCAGCDIVDIKRFKKILDRSPKVRQRIFLPNEARGASLEKLAGIFAAKEAATKALSIKPGQWQEIELSYKKSGKPELILHGPIKTKFQIHDLSIAHDGNYALALACFIKED